MPPTPPPTHYLEIKIPLVFPEDEGPDPDLVSHGQDALADLRRRAGIAKHLAGSDFQITVRAA